MANYYYPCKDCQNPVDDDLRNIFVQKKGWFKYTYTTLCEECLNKRVK